MLREFVGFASVDVYARLYASNGAPASGEFLVNTGAYPLCQSSGGGRADGSFMITWGLVTWRIATNGLDIYARTFPARHCAQPAQSIRICLATIRPAHQRDWSRLHDCWTSLGQDAP